MIHSIVGFPNADWMHFTNECDLLKSDYCKLGKSSIEKFQPKMKRFLSSVMLAYSKDVRTFKSWLPYLMDSPEMYSIVLCGSRSEMLQYGIPIKEDLVFLDLLMMASSRETCAISMKSTNTLEESIEEFSSGGFISSMQSMFYRIPDKDRRKKIVNGTYEYLAGISGTKPKSGIASLDKLLKSDQVSRFREVCKIVSENPDKAADLSGEFDPFEIMYCLKKSGAL